MRQQLSGMKIAILAANGVQEDHLLAVQKSLRGTGAVFKIISADNGLINGWNGKGWGHSFPVDNPINTALGVDFSAVIIPGGQGSLDKFKKTAHTKRFIGSVQTAQKPVVAIGNATELLEFTQQMNDSVLSGDMNEEFIAKMLAFLASTPALEEAA